MSKQGFGGWIAYTFKDPETILDTIWALARVDFTGLRGFPNIDKEYLEFTGIRIRKKENDSFVEKRPETQLNFEITDATKIQPEFLDLWDYLIANKILYGKLSASERKMILASIASAGEKKLKAELDKAGQHHENNKATLSFPSADANNKKSKYKGVDQRHEALWRMIKPVVEAGGTKDEMRAAILAKKKIGKKEDDIKKIQLPGNNTLRIIIDKYHKK